MSEKKLTEKQFYTLLQMFAEKGFNGVKTGEVDKVLASDGAQGSFVDKADVYAAVLTEAFETFWVPVFKTLKHAPTLENGLKAFFEASAKMLTTGHDLAEKTLVLKAFRPVPGEINEIKKRLESIQAKQFSYFEDFLTRMVSIGQVREGAPLIKMAQDLNDVLFDQCEAAIAGVGKDELETYPFKALKLMKQDDAKPHHHHAEA